MAIHKKGKEVKIMQVRYLATEGFITNTLLQNLISFLAPVAAIVLVAFCVVQAVGMIRGVDGNGVKKLVSGVLIILLLIGIMFAAGSFETYGQLFKDVTNTAVTQIGDNANNLLG